MTGFFDSPQGCTGHLSAGRTWLLVSYSFIRPYRWSKQTKSRPLRNVKNTQHILSGTILCSGDGLSTTTVRICPHDCQPHLFRLSVWTSPNWPRHLTLASASQERSSSAQRRSAVRLLPEIPCSECRDSETQCLQCLHRHLTWRWRLSFSFHFQPANPLHVLTWFPPRTWCWWQLVYHRARSAALERNAQGCGPVASILKQWQFIGSSIFCDLRPTWMPLKIWDLARQFGWPFPCSDKCTHFQILFLSCSTALYFVQAATFTRTPQKWTKCQPRSIHASSWPCTRHECGPRSFAGSTIVRVSTFEILSESWLATWRNNNMPEENRPIRPGYVLHLNELRIYRLPRAASRGNPIHFFGVCLVMLWAKRQKAPKRSTI